MHLMGLRYIQIIGICAGFIGLIALAHGGGECASLGGDCASTSGWDPMAKLDEIGTGNYDKAPAAQTKWPEKSRTARWDKAAYGFEDNETAENGAVEDQTTDNTVRADKPPVVDKPEVANDIEAATGRSAQFEEMLIPIESIAETDVLIDVSENATEFIPGAIALSYAEFLSGGGLKSMEEVAQILGDAGISHNDSVVIYGECLPCGGGPAASTYIYWMMKSLGQDKVRIMDGTVADWKALGLPTVNGNETDIRPTTSYTTYYMPDFIATYDYVKSGVPQIIDARTMQDFGTGSIPGAINIPYESVIDNNRIKDEAALKKTFAVLSDARPVVVYTQTGIKASVVWFALKLMGYDAKLYSWQDWYVHEKALKGNSSNLG